MNDSPKLKFSLLAIVLFLVVGIFSIGTTASAAPSGSSYIVVFKDSINISRSVPEVAKAYGLQVGYVYENALTGFSAIVPAGQLTALQNDPRVAYVANDFIRTIDVQDTPTGVNRIFASSNTNIDIDSSDDFRVDVDVAIIDTGIDLEHPDLNVVNSTTCLNTSGGGPPWARSYFCGVGGDDDHYHGTHVAGTVAAMDNNKGVVGVAPGARLWAVKVCNAQGSCPSSAIVAGIDYIVANSGEIEVANMSLGGSGFSQAEYDAIQSAVESGVAFAVAAGNSDDDANFYSPAGFDNVLTVSALADFDGLPGGFASPTCLTDQDETLAYFSNWGSAVDIAAPGVCILSTFPIEQGSYGTISGTSMASPHATGALALLASANNPGNSADVFNLYSQVVNAGNFNWNDDSGDGVQEPLLDVGGFLPVLIAGSGNIDTPPNLTISYPGDGASFSSGQTISFNGSASDDEDSDLTSSMVWGSDLDGEIGAGGAFDAVLSDGTHNITAEVTDSAGNTTSASVTIAIGSSNFPVTLNVNAYKTKGTRYADLAWEGAASTSIDIFRDGSLFATTNNDGFFLDDSLGKGGGSASYQVCEAGTAICSAVVSVIW